MRRTQILLEDQHYRFLIAESRRLGLSLSELLRRLVSERMAKHDVVGGGVVDEDPLESLIGMVKGPGDDTARHHDSVLYGAPRR